MNVVYRSKTLWQRTGTVLAGLCILFWLSSCDDSGVSPAEQDVANFSQQLEGTWNLEKVTVNPGTSQSVVIAPVKEFACDKLSTAFESKDVVSSYTITYSNKVLKVMKHFTCRLAPEELSWRIEPDAESGTSVNWMTGKNFTIKEINEATLTSEFKLLFFNLDHCSPDGKAATSATKNKLSLQVQYDTREQSTFRLEFSKSN